MKRALGITPALLLFAAASPASVLILTPKQGPGNNPAMEIQVITEIFNERGQRRA